MNETIEQKNEFQKKSFHKKYIIAAVCFILIVTAMVFIYFTQEPKSDPASEKIIREAVAQILNKAPNELIEKDFAAIKRLDLSGKKVYDISLLEKFTNLEELDLSDIPIPKPKIPKWKVILTKLRVYSIEICTKRYMEKYFIDLSPLEKLTNLKVLYLQHTVFKDLPLLKRESPLKIVMSNNQLIEYRASEYTERRIKNEFENALK